MKHLPPFAPTGGADFAILLSNIPGIRLLNLPLPLLWGWVTASTPSSFISSTPKLISCIFDNVAVTPVLLFSYCFEILSAFSNVLFSSKCSSRYRDKTLTGFVTNRINRSCRFFLIISRINPFGNALPATIICCSVQSAPGFNDVRLVHLGNKSMSFPDLLLYG